MSTFPGTMSPRRRAVPEDARASAPADAPLFAEPAPDPQPAEPAASFAPAPYPHNRATIAMVYHGVPVQMELSDVKASAVESLIDKLLAREGWSAPQPPPAAAPPRPQKPAELRQPPLYQPDGTPCCPIHKTALKQGQYGLFCPSKAEPPYGNDKGYCMYSVKEA